VKGYFEFLDNDFQDSGEQWRPLRGLRAIIEALESSAEERGARLWNNQPVQSINYVHTDAEHPYHLVTKNYRVHAKHVVLTPPPLALKKLTGNVIDALTSQDEFNSLLGEPVAKCGMVFESAWWEPEVGDLGLYQTSSTCLGGVLVGADTGPNGEKMIHTVYNDGPCAYTMWPDRFETSTPAQLTEYILQQLQYLFPAKEIPAPLVSECHFWSEGAWHMQKGGYDITIADLAVWASHPIEGQHGGVFLVGESYAVRRTWSEGAIQQSQMVLKNYFGIENFADFVQG